MTTTVSTIINDIYELTRKGELNAQGLEQVTIAIKNARSYIAVETKSTLRVGAKVTIRHAKLAHAQGIVTKVARTRATVKTPQGNYLVPFNLLEVE